MRRALLAPALAATAVLVLSGCTGGAEDGAAEAQPSASVVPADPSAPLPAGFRAEQGTAFAYGLPEDVGFVPGTDETRDGTVIQRWTLPVEGTGANCTVIASEQPAYRGQFPGALIEIFETLSEDDEVLANEAEDPPPGATGAVRQESTFQGRLADGSTLPGHLYQQQLLTPGRTLVSLTVSGPESAVSTCRLTEILASLRLTGQELPAPDASAGSSDGPVGA